MPFRPAPKPEENTRLRKVRPIGWDAEGPQAEYFEILDYLDPAVLKAAQASARKTTINANGNGQATEGWSDTAYYHALFTAQLKGWKVLVDPSVPPDTETMYEEGGYLWWQFTPKNVAALPWDIADFLNTQINSCGGALATSGFITKADDGTLLTFRRPAESVGAGPAPGSADPQ